MIKKNALKKVGNIFGIDLQNMNDHVIENGIKDINIAGVYIGGGFALSEGIARTSTVVVETTSIGLRSLGLGMAGFGCVIGVGLGGFLTYRYCEELLDKFEAFYKNNAKEFGNSYELGLKYLSE